MDLRALSLFLIAVVWTSAACDLDALLGEEDAAAPPPPAPCAGACPVDECVFGICTGNSSPPEPDPVDAGGGEEVVEAGDAGEDEVARAYGPKVVHPDNCEVDEDCPEDRYCGDGEGDAGLCRRGCRGDVGCESGEVCHRSLHACVPGCRESGGCPEGHFCRLTEGIDVGTCRSGCRDDAGCDEGLSCDVGSGRCVGTVCEHGGDCPMGEHCAQGFCLPGCMRSADCGRGMACYEGVCEIARCQRDERCEAGFFCNPEGACEEGCRGDVECAAQMICDEVSRVCEPGCREDESCPQGRFCEIPEGAEGGLCVDGCRPSQRACGGDLVCDPDTRECVEGPCRNHVDCGSGFVCDRGERACVPGCLEPDDCGVGAYCVRPDFEFGVCEPGCQTDAQCPEDSQCVRETNTCTCTQDDQCGDGLICEVGACVEPCVEHGACALGFRCDLNSGRCERGCRDDGFEPNETFDQAPLIAPGAYDMGMCRENDEENRDCYKIRAEPGQALNIETRFSTLAVNLDLRLYDGEGALRLSSETERAPERMAFAVDEAGDYTFCVVQRGFASDIVYTLEVGLGE